mgnify:CR=1 FL=1
MPAILSLHGKGESGTDGLRQTAIGLGVAIPFNRAEWPFVVVFPQKPTQDCLWLEHGEFVNEVLAEVESEFAPDPTRRYITGLSQGGRGVFDLAGKLDWRFAAAAPVCGWTENSNLAKEFKGIPVWAIHGDADEVVPISGSVEAVESIVAAGGDAKLTSLPGVGHNAWDFAYREAGLAEWFLQFQLVDIG